MPRGRRLSDSDLIGTIYDAAMQPDGAAWQGVLEALRQRFEASSAFFFTPFLQPSAGHWRSINIPPQFFEDYAAHFIHIDVWEAAVRKQVQRGACITDEMILPVNELKKTEWFADGLKPLDISRLLASVISDDSIPETPRTYLSFYRPIGADPFGSGELQSYRELAPHLRRANDIFWRLRGADLRHQSDLAVLDRLPIGVVLLNASGEVLHTNPAAQRALARNDGLGLSQRRLTAGAASANARLYRAIGQVCQTGNGNGQHAGGFLAIDRPSGKRPWTLLIAPLPVQAPPWLGQQIPAAIVFITDPEAQPRAGSDMLAQVYGLTPAEQRVLDDLLQGLSAKEIAERHGVSFHTVRSQMKSLFEKTGVNRYGELVRMAAQGDVLTGGEEGAGEA